MWSIQKLVTLPVFPRSSCTAFSVKGRRKRSILRELVGGFGDGGTAKRKNKNSISETKTIGVGACVQCTKSIYRNYDNLPTRSLGASSLTVESDLEKFRFEVVA